MELSMTMGKKKKKIMSCVSQAVSFTAILPYSKYLYICTFHFHNTQRKSMITSLSGETVLKLNNLLELKRSNLN